MKKILNLFVFFLMATTAARADVMPYYVSSISPSSIGVYQANKNLKIYQEPNDCSDIVIEAVWDSKSFSSKDISAGNLFTVFIPSKELAFLLVIDESEEWVQVIFNNNGEQKGWIKNEEEGRFLNWRTFYNNYGRKYGVYYMKDAPESAKNIYSANFDDAQKLGQMNMPQKIKMTAVKGNWLLISVFDFDKISKIGWVKWRNTEGKIYLFPSIK